MRTSSSSNLPRSVSISSSRSKWVKIRSGRNSLASVAGHGQAEARQVVQLAEHPRERRLAAVVRAADDEDPLWVVRGGSRCTRPMRRSCTSLCRQREIERVARRATSLDRADTRVAERQTGRRRVGAM